MPKISGQTKKGFTIIEVVLVLAIAGLIFLMVFLALPALQRSQRDTQRRDDLARFQTAIANYQTNNRGKVPGNNVVATDLRKAYAEFMINYLWAGGDEFVDPDGKLYVIGSVCSNMANPGTENVSCSPIAGGNVAKTDRIDLLAYSLAKNVYAADSGGGSETASSDWDGSGTPTTGQLTPNINERGAFNEHAIYIFQNGQCNGETVEPSTGVRKVAIQYKLEGGGIYCGNN